MKNTKQENDIGNDRGHDSVAYWLRFLFFLFSLKFSFLSLEVTGSPRRAGSFTLKSFGGPGEPEASLGELGPGNSRKRPFPPPFLVSFAFLIKTLNDHLFHTVTGVQHRKSTRKDQKINE